MREKLIPQFLTFGVKRKWVFLISATLACVFFFLVFGFPLLTGPRLSPDQKQWKEFQGDDPQGYPLEVVSHGYRMIQACRREPKRTEGSPSRFANLVEWEWKIVIKNKSPRNEQVYVHYFLVDKERLRVDVDYRISPQPVRAWETVTVQHQTEMVYEDLPRIAAGAWEISWGGSQKKRKGF
jgi:hypothetical protein